ncbi:hypothetical protein N0V84_004325 [Fusarium piperis]|uniref:Uncharacterized protein n=1 Tax=Fusarium piperis TaxID=1435070 RepID=A0A9W8WG05_9HYPO|nr:hypothetical protein N0V84_004325 [Fusarium piperis]
MAEPSLTRLPPSLEEQEEYYYGLPSRPKLVARSSTAPWSPQYDRWPISKCLYVVGEHAIAELWNDADSSLRRQILQVVKKVDWTAIDVLRVGYAHDNERTGERFSRPVTVLISVKTGLTFEQGYDVVAACSQILESHNLNDVQVEMKESEVSRAASTPLPASLSTPAVSTSNQATSSQLLKFSSRPLTGPVDTTALLSEYLGLSIAPSDAPNHEGTKCLYLRSGTKVFALTCRHVVFTNSHPNTTYQHDNTTVTHTVMQPGNGTWAKHKSDLAGLINDDNEYLDQLKSEPNPVRRQTLTQSTKARLDEREALARWLAEWDNPEMRVFGHVIFSPAFGFVQTQGSSGKRLRDWALIELSQDKHSTPLASLSNLVYIERGTQYIVEKRRLGWKHLGPSTDFAGSAVRVEGTIPEREIRRPRSSTPSDDPALLVIKHGDMVMM